MERLYAIVQPGESIGAVARRVAPAGLARDDVLAFADVLARRNGFSGVGGMVYPGQFLDYLDSDVPTAPLPPPSPAVGVVPSLESVKPSGTLTTINNAQDTLLSGEVRDKRFTRRVKLAPNTRLVNCAMDGGIGTDNRSQSPAVVEHCYVFGWWMGRNDATGEGADGIEIHRSFLYGASLQALRPMGKGTIRISDSWLICDQQPPAGAHTETMQVMYGATVLAERCAFSRKPVTNNTVTAVQTFESGSDGVGSVLTDCAFGYYNEATGLWERGGGYYAVYPAKAKYVRPVVYGYSDLGAFYNVTPANIIDPIFR